MAIPKPESKLLYTSDLLQTKGSCLQRMERMNGEKRGKSGEGGGFKGVVLKKV